MRKGIVFAIFWTLIKAGKLHCAFLNFYRTFYRSFPHQKIQYQRLSLDTFKRVCEDFLFKAETSSISKLLSCLWSSAKYFESLILLPFCKLRPLSNRKKTKEGGSQKSSFRFLSDFNFFYINKKWFLFVCWFGFFAFFFFTLFICRI